jgi:hypothetical protein
MSTFKKTCDECAEEFTSKKREARFCCTACRKTYNNRRAVRGAELYDLMMACRYDRDFAYANKLPSLMARRCSEWRDADVARNNGTRSWQRPIEWMRDNSARLRSIVCRIR